MTEVKSKEERYTDPEADIVLKSSEGREFRVHAFYLQAASAVFRDLISNKPSSAPLAYNARQPIDIDAISNELEFFLDLITGVATRKEVTFDIIAKPYQLSDLFTCTTLLDVLAWRLIDVAGEHPWKIFVLAAQADQVRLAKAALRSMHRYHSRSSILSLNHKHAAQLPLSYALGLMHSALACRGKLGLGNTQACWDLMSDHFKPKYA